MNVNYKIHNHCNSCKIKYPKDKKYCSECGRRLRTTAHITKSNVRERMKNLAVKRY